MNISHFIQIAQSITSIYSDFGILKKFRNLQSAVGAYINQPNETTSAEIGTHLETLRDVVGDPGFQDFPATWRPLLDELGIARLMTDAIYEMPKSQIRTSGPIMNDALSAIELEANFIQEAINSLNEALRAFEKLHYDGDALEPGDAEISIRLPRELFGNTVSDYSKQLDLFDQIITAFSEVATGKIEKIEIRQLSTTEPVLFAGATVATVHFTLKVVHSIIDAWKKVAEIRFLQAQAKALKLDQSIPKALDDEIEKKVKEQLETAVNEALKDRKKVDAELRSKVNVMTKKLASLIDRGATVEGWAEPIDDENENSKPQANEEIEAIQRIASEIRQIGSLNEQRLDLPPPLDEE